MAVEEHCQRAHCNILYQDISSLGDYGNIKITLYCTKLRKLSVFKVLTWTLHCNSVWRKKMTGKCNMTHTVLAETGQLLIHSGTSNSPRTQSVLTLDLVPTQRLV